MCGIAGIIGRTEEVGGTIIRSMTDAIVHRGPDDDGYYVGHMLAMGMRRLSIIDVEGGKQPIASENGNLVIVFNGEIYNYRELRADLAAQGYTFKTHTDTEVILRLFETEGSACLAKLRGMFAFAILNKTKKELFLARDPFGIKPLYYLVENGACRAFASEIKSILEIPGFVRTVNDEAVFNYLSFQYNPLRESFLKGIWKLDPGSFMRVRLETGEFTAGRYAEFLFAKGGAVGAKEATTTLHTVLKDSVRHHMIADVPVGAFLSGGVDSGIIAALAQGERAQAAGEVGSISTFTVGFAGASEAREARVTAHHIGSDHYEAVISPETYFEELPKIMWHFDEPVADPAAASLYFLAREARKKVKVVLSGEGADELFGGYNIYREPFARRRLNIIPRTIRERILRPLADSSWHFYGVNFLKRFFSGIKYWYIGNAHIFNPNEVAELWRGNPYERMSLAPLYARVTERTESEKMQYIDINTWLVGDILAKADKMTMAHSLELRVPFLDREIANFARALPPVLKWRRGTTKYLLRRVADTLLTPGIARRKKLGFPTPVGRWFTAERIDLYERITKNSYILKHFNISIIERMIADHIARRADYGRKIYLLLSLAIWHEVFIEKSVSLK